MTLLTPAKLSSLVAELDAAAAKYPRDQMEAMLAAFRERFPLERLARLEGEELLLEMHGRESRDSMAYWLEFKDDDSFHTRAFGSIAGGSAFKFGLFQAAEDMAWTTGSPLNRKTITAKKAARIAARQRDELLASVAVLQALPDDPWQPPWAELQTRIEEAAPEYGHLAFFHKALRLYAPDVLDDYHSLPHQQHHLIQLGVVPDSQGLYANARYFAALLGELRTATSPDLPLKWVTAAMYGVTGAPVVHWRIGTSYPPEPDMWPPMRDGNEIAVGWDELGDLGEVVSGASGNEAIRNLKAAVQRCWSDWDPRRVGRDARQIWAFYGKMEPGHRVYAAKGRRILGIGEITGNYEYLPASGSYRHRRSVRWLSTSEFQSPSNVGLQTTVYELKQEKAADLLAEAAQHLDGAVAPEVPTSAPTPLPHAVRAIHEQLERKGQVILYGPPGTGKTWRALQAAKELVARELHDQRWGQLPAERRRALEAPGGAQRIWTCTFHPAYGYEDFVEGLRPVPVEGGLDFRPRPGLFKRICSDAAKHPDEPFVLIIDEFNRGDAPRIFGELLTLLELDKRDGTSVVLPTSGEPFTVPRKLRVIATMNTADRSIALLDAALRRRFGFIEYMPVLAPLAGAVVEGIPLDRLLEVLNQRLMATLGHRARNLQVGHAYLMSQAKPLQSVLTLRNAIQYDVLPLLQEYCADDPDALERVVGAKFYDRERGAFRGEPFARGAEELFLAALNAWDPEGLRADQVRDEADLNGEDEEEDTDGA